MELLLKREQSKNVITRKVRFRLWAKIELTEEEQDLIDRYWLARSVLIDGSQPTLLRNSLIISLVSALFIGGIAFQATSDDGVITMSVLIGLFIGFLWYHDHRETIYVQDLIKGRYFRCGSVVELAKKEAWMEGVLGYLRQVMESAKHWDGTETITIEALPKEEAKRAILQGG